MPSPTAPNPRLALPDNMQTIMAYQDVERALSSQLRTNPVGVVQGTYHGFAPRNPVEEGDSMQTITSFYVATPDIEPVAQSPPEGGSSVSPGTTGQGSGATNPHTPYPLPPRPLWPSTSEVAAQYRNVLVARHRQEASPNSPTHGTSAVAPAVVGSMNGVIINGGLPVNGNNALDYSGASSYPGSCNH